MPAASSARAGTVPDMTPTPTPPAHYSPLDTAVWELLHSHELGALLRRVAALLDDNGFARDAFADPQLVRQMLGPHAAALTGGTDALLHVVAALLELGEHVARMDDTGLLAVGEALDSIAMDLRERAARIQQWLRRAR